MSLSPTVMRRLVRELNQLRAEPPEGIRVVVNEDNLLDVTGIIEGPETTPYAGGYFRVKFNFTGEFPSAPPKCRMLTKIFHPNVSSAGEICVNTLKKDWQPTYGIAHILVTVKCLLIYPNPESALDEEAGKLLLEAYQSYFDRAKLITSVHATPRVPPPEFASATPPPSARTTTSQPALSAPTPPTARKASSPAPAGLPHLSVSVSNENANTATTKRSVSASSTSAEKEVDGKVPPVPLSNTNTNTTVAVGSGASTTPGPSTDEVTPATKAVKRPAAASAGEKRKKALKRL